MFNAEDSRIQLGMRQVEVQRRNLVQMCRLTVKSLIDKSNFESVDDNSDELVNFFAVMEQLLLFRMKPQKTWYGTAEPRHYWEYIKVACRKLSNNCITNIESIENIKTLRGKGRAWLRVALMEKRLSDYFASALSQSRVTKTFYSEGSVMLSEDSGMLCGTLLGLNAIDFSFCLKGDNMELMGPLVIDYSPYLVFHHSEESMSKEDGLGNFNVSSSIMSEVDVDEETWSVKYRNLETKFKNICEQKGYLEELVRLRQSQLDEAARQRHHLLDTLEHYEAEGMRERQQLEGVIIELQGQLAAVKDQMKILQRELDSLRARVLPQPDISVMGNSKTALAMREMNDEPVLHLPRQLLSSQESDIHSQESSEIGSTGNVSQHLLVAGGTRSTLSQSAVKEETQSLVPLAGSFSSEVSFRSGDIQMSALPKASSDLSNDNEQINKDINVVTDVQISAGLSRGESESLNTENEVTNNDKEVAGSAAQQLKEENGNKVEQGTIDLAVSVRDTDVESPEERSSPDGEVSDEEKTILSAVAGITDMVRTTVSDETEIDQAKSGDVSSSSDEGRAPPQEMTVDETSSDNSNGEWTLLPRATASQDHSSSSAEELGISDERSVPEVETDITTQDESQHSEDTA